MKRICNEKIARRQDIKSSPAGIPTRTRKKIPHFYDLVRFSPHFRHRFPVSCHHTEQDIPISQAGSKREKPIVSGKETLEPFCLT
jgi:hypothetical protein